jgi:tetratricopeptide (TPR) repeat protein
VAYTSEIEKLEQRFNENRKGRTFAPLADAYRKAGLIDNAVELCQEGLKLHPDYVSAWIVFGRCLMDKKDDRAAEDVYKKVLGLDPENVLALRTLADIAERGKRPDAAVDWLTRLLAADPMNADAADALARVKGKAAVAVAPDPSPVPTPSAAQPAEAPTLEIERASPEEPVAVPVTGRPAGHIEMFDGTLDVDESAHTAAKAEGLEVLEDVELKPERLEIEGLAPTQYEGSGMFQLDNLPKPPGDLPEVGLPAEVEEDIGPVDLPLIMPDDIKPDDTPRRRAPAPPPPPVPPPPPAPPPSPAPPPRGPVSARLSDDDGAADRAILSRAEPVLTETMAELYLKQGHREEALRVYRALLAQHPGDARLKNRVDALEGRKQTSGQSAAAFLKSILRREPSAAPPAADEQVSALVAGAFQETAEAPPLGEPSKPADDSISLESVFGEAGGERNESGEGDAGSESGGDGGSEGEGFSFDEFFKNPTPPGGGAGVAGPRGAGAAGGGPGVPGAGGPAPRPSGRQARPPEDEGDADQFQAWLKKLKS